jgi:hypothetical protein
MDYMGLGMNKELYTRKPKKAFKKLKTIWSKKTNPNRGNEHEQLSEERKLEIAHEVRLERNRTRRNVLLFLAALFTAIGFGIDATVDHIAMRKAKAQNHFLVDSWERNQMQIASTSKLPIYQEPRHHVFMDAGDLLLKDELYKDAAQKHYNASLVYYDDSPALFGQLKAMIEACDTESRFFYDAMSLLAQLQHRYPDSPILIDWGSRLRTAFAGNEKRSLVHETKVT